MTWHWQSVVRGWFQFSQWEWPTSFFSRSAHVQIKPWFLTCCWRAISNQIYGQKVFHSNYLHPDTASFSNSHRYTRAPVLREFSSLAGTDVLAESLLRFSSVFNHLWLRNNDRRWPSLRWFMVGQFWSWAAVQVVEAWDAKEVVSPRSLLCITDAAFLVGPEHAHAHE